MGKEATIDVAKELTELTEIINENNDLETALFLDLFTIEEKSGVLNDVCKKLNLSTLTTNFLSFLNQEKRLGILPMIYKNLIVIDDHHRGFLKGVIEGNSEGVESEFQQKITSYLSKELGKSIELSYQKSDKITAGYRVTVEDLQLDASIDNQLKQFKKTVLNS